MDYREVRLEELGEVAKLHNELAYFIQRETKDIYWDFENLSEEDVRKQLEAFIGNEERKIYIARDEHQVLAFIAGEIIGCHLPISSVQKVGYISAAYVQDEFRGQGIMKKLEQIMAGYFKQCGLKYIELHFISNNLMAKKSWNNLGYGVFRNQARKEI